MLWNLRQTAGPRSRREVIARAVRGGALAVAAALLAALPAHAVDYVWNNAAGGNWNAPANWTPNGVPSSNADTATITLAGHVHGHGRRRLLRQDGHAGGRLGDADARASRRRAALTLFANSGTPTMTSTPTACSVTPAGRSAPFGQPSQVAVNGRYDWTGGIRDDERDDHGRRGGDDGALRGLGQDAHCGTRRSSTTGRSRSPAARTSTSRTTPTLTNAAAGSSTCRRTSASCRPAAARRR